MLSPATVIRVVVFATTVGRVSRTPPPTRSFQMRIVPHLLAFVDHVREPLLGHAHCDLPCGVYDPAQARIEAESVKAIQEKYHENKDAVFRERCVQIKEERAELVKHHLWVLWTDYFKPNHLETYPDLHDKFWTATKLAGDS